ncbi:hypothetical protein L2E82_53055 [Cichorium intybus]|nr:hypothetical protein L2E82_53055 [Cichorium intybus]
MGIVLHGGPHDSSVARAWPTTRAFGGRGPLLLVGKQAGAGRQRVASSPDSDLEAFSHNPAHGSFAPLAFQPSADDQLCESTVPLVLGRADIEGSKSNVANERVAATSQLSLCSELAVRRPGKAPEGAVPSRPPAGTRRPALAAEAARAVRRQPTGSGLDPRAQPSEPILSREKITLPEAPADVSGLPNVAFATTTKIRTDGRSAQAHAQGLAATAAPSYSSGPGTCPDGRV